MIGEKIRSVRQSQELSLSQVAEKAEISVATLSRIETNKQALDLGLFLILARILKTNPQELIADDDGDGGIDPLVTRISALGSTQRTALWRDLAANRREAGHSRNHMRNLNQQVEELLAQVEFLREEILAVQRRMTRS